MNNLHFQSQVQRLVRTYGPTSYTEERVKIIWREVNAIADEAWTQIVDQLIGNHRQAPMLPEIRELVAIARAKSWEREKKQNASDAKAFFKSSFAPGDIQTLCGMVVDRIKGKTRDEDWAANMKAFKNAVAPDIALCRACDSEGLVFSRDDAEYEWVYRCYCFAGSKHPMKYPVWSRS